MFKNAPIKNVKFKKFKTSAIFKVRLTHYSKVRFKKFKNGAIFKVKLAHYSKLGLKNLKMALWRPP